MTKELKHQYSAVDARDRIIDAALQVFADVGYAGASMRTIAEKAGVSAALIHHHFKDKETLWKIVNKRISLEFHEYVSKGTEMEDPTSSFERLMRNFQQYWINHPLSLRLQLWRMLEASIEERQSRSSFLNEYFVPKIRQAQKAGVVRDDIPAGLAMLTFGGLMLFSLLNRLELDHAVSLDSNHPLDNDELFTYLISLIATTGKTGK
ncbi:C-terminal [Bartonella choladocola]|uniref:TetR/AcrR family transcriptional regulator n=1 Tax=Bartonella TaxID=773 RepID=UPI0018DB8560|nr:TetR/AcrR family transcriptional regulator [Bartonella choladocola]MBI0140930.1 TetR/AcrR family transcriptional regulator [Bartonella choladocola]